MDTRVGPCPTCDGLEWVCERHPDKPWAGYCCQPVVRDGSDPSHRCCGCGGAGQPCATCNQRSDGSVSLSDGDWLVPIRR